jgi:hypothetical protein
MTYLHAVDVDDDRLLDAADDPWETARDGEVWRWDGARLVPASPDEVALLREIDARRRLRYWADNLHQVSARSRDGGWRRWLRAISAWALPHHPYRA